MGLRTAVEPPAFVEAVSHDEALISALASAFASK
jgi:hypothetical protein